VTARQILDLAIAAGFRGNDAVIATAIALAESGGNPNILNGEYFSLGQAIPAKLQWLYGTKCSKPYCGDYSLGLWQINMRPDMAPSRLALWSLPSVNALYDPATNARVAFALYRGRGGGFGDWSTFIYPNPPTGYLNFLGIAQGAWALYQAEQEQPAVIPPAPPPDPQAGQVPTPAEPGPISPPAATSIPRPKRDLVLLLGQFWRVLRLWWSS